MGCEVGRKIEEVLTGVEGIRMMTKGVGWFRKEDKRCGQLVGGVEGV